MNTPESPTVLKGSVARVQAVLARELDNVTIQRMPESTRTAEEAAQACGVKVGQIVKSLVFGGSENLPPWLVLVAGDNRVNESSLGAKLGEKLNRADANFVRERTGFAIGGVAPIGHTGPVRVIMDHALLQYDVVWAAAGAPNTVFQIAPSELHRITGARIEIVS